MESQARSTEGQQSEQQKPPSLIDWIAKVAPHLERFDYFKPYADALENCIGGNLRLACASPPQHGKSLLALYALLYLATFFPGYKHAYVTYSSARSREIAKAFKLLAAEVGLVVGGTLDNAELAGGTTIKFTSVEAALTGAPITGVCIIDDPFKDHKEARSPVVRKDRVEWWKSSARSRRHAGTSFIVMATRWHVADLTGYLVKHEGWQYLNFKAIAEPANDNDTDHEGRIVSDPLRRFPGESLCPSRKPPEFFAEEKADIYWWASMYQGMPVPAGGALFRAPTYYRVGPDGLPQIEKGFRWKYGVDLGYSEKSHADYSACVEVWGVRDEKGALDAHGKPIIWYYVVGVVRTQVEAPAFVPVLRSKLTTRRGKFYWYAAGTEKGSADFIKQKVPLVVLDPKGRDKLSRAQRTAELWNLGRIMLPLAEGDDEGDSSIPWVAEFLEEVTSFTGIKDPHDDQVDALVPAIDQLEKSFRTDDDDLTVYGGRGRW